METSWEQELSRFTTAAGTVWQANEYLLKENHV